MFVPVLPTTPFLLLAAICYARSSERFYHWLLNNRWFGEYLKNYREGRGIPLREKTLTVLALWLTIGFTTLLRNVSMSFGHRKREFTVDPGWRTSLSGRIPAG